MLVVEGDEGVEEGDVVVGEDDGGAVVVGLTVVLGAVDEVAGCVEVGAGVVVEVDGAVEFGGEVVEVVSTDEDVLGAVVVVDESGTEVDVVVEVGVVLVVLVDVDVDVDVVVSWLVVVAPVVVGMYTGQTSTWDTS